MSLLSFTFALENRLISFKNKEKLSAHAHLQDCNVLIKPAIFFINVCLQKYKYFLLKLNKYRVNGNCKTFSSPNLQIIMQMVKKKEKEKKTHKERKKIINLIFNR